ncbi:MAG TPA: hypothetical protein VE860_12000, partial [Chthoniobacterales bacterium]|nr:hypothetical protein [Chthoniobacterales bacterium]
TAYCLLLTAYCLLLTTHCLLLTAYYSLLTAHCLLLSGPLGRIKPWGWTFCRACFIARRA